MNKITVNNKSISLSNNDFLAKGGQGSIFVKGSTVYKIYTDPSEMFTEEKMVELQKITDKRVIVPKDFIYQKNSIVGFTMPYTKGSIPLIKLFNTVYRDQVNFSAQDSLEMIEKMQHTIQNIHDQNILQVDGNELNYIVSKKEPYFIDVDSYQTKHNSATVIMPSIRDYQAKSFSELTDWYSFGIIAVQLFIGIHPYKGRHPNYKRDLKKRMLDNVSIFNKDVSVPKAVRDFSNIPSEYMNWFIDVFEKGKRLPPPLVAGTMKVKPSVTIIIGTDSVVITKIKEYSSKITLVTPHGVIHGAIMEYQKKKEVLTIGSSFISSGVVSIIKGKINIAGKSLIDCDSFTIQNNIVYAKYQDKLHEITFINGYANYKTTIISKNSSKMMNGFIYQNLFQKSFMTIPYKSGNVISTKIPELDDYKIIDGKYENKVAMIIGLNNKTKKYDKITIIFNQNHGEYRYSIKEDVDYYINFTVLSNGICIEIEEDGVICVFTNNINKTIIKEIKDKVVSTKWKLTHIGNDAMFYENNSLFKLRMK